MSRYMQIEAHVTGSAAPRPDATCADATRADSDSSTEGMPVPAQAAGGDGTLLGVVPVPGTGTSLVVVGYAVEASDGQPGQSASGQELDPSLVIDRARRRVWADGREVVLTYQEFELLAFLSQNPDMVFSRAELVAGAWQADARQASRTVDVHVSRLRRKLGPVYGHCVCTEYRAGYRFKPLASRRASAPALGA